MKHEDIYIVSALRTPVGKAPRGVFRNTRPDDLLSHVLKGVLDANPNVDPAEIDDVIIGCAMPEGEQGMNVARISSLLAGIPDTVPAMTINRFCSSGLQTIALAAERIASGSAEAIIAGGAESMSMVPLGGHSMRANPAYFSTADENVAIAYGMGITAEKVAERWNISREQQQEFALQSHQRAAKAVKSGEFNDEILPFAVNAATPDLSNGEVINKEFIIKDDEGPRADTSVEQMSKLRTVFAAKGSISAATCSQMSDGAAALLVVSESFMNKHSLTPLARYCGFSVAGVPPEVMGIGPIAAIPKVLKPLDLSINELDWIELNEAFASQSLAVIQELALDPEKVNPLGGAIALGHPLGATGSIRAATLLHGMKRNGLKYGMVTMCIGTGMGAAGIFESV